MATPRQEERFEYKRFPCVILFMPAGYRCGYVGVETNKRFNVGDISCHGGITYEESHLFFQNDGNILWIGFDCGHCFDGCDAEKIEEYFSDDQQVMNSYKRIRDFYEIQNQYTIRTLEYVKKECEHIVEQLLKLGVKPPNNADSNECKM